MTLILDPEPIIGTLLYTVLLPTGRVDVTFHRHTPTGRLQRRGQRYTIAEWPEALMFAARETVRVKVRVSAA